MDKWSLLLRLPCSAEKVGLLPGGLEVNVSGAPVRMISKGCCHLTDPESVCVVTCSFILSLNQDLIMESVVVCTFGM